MIRDLPITTKFNLYTGVASACLIVEKSTKMPAYTGFLMSKALSQAWHLLQYHRFVPNNIPLEKFIGLALLAGLIGYISVKQALIKGGKNTEKAESNSAENDV